MANDCIVTVPLFAVINATERKHRVLATKKAPSASNVYSKLRKCVEAYCRRVAKPPSNRETGGNVDDEKKCLEHRRRLERRVRKTRAACNRGLSNQREVASRKPQLPFAGTANVEIELRLFLQKSRCHCCSSLKIEIFLRQLRIAFGDELPENCLEYYFEYRHRRKMRIFFSCSGISWDTKTTLYNSVISLKSHTSASLNVSVESSRRRLSHASTSPGDVRRVAAALSSGEEYAAAVCRFVHPRDKRLSITWKEPAFTDVSTVCIEYEFDNDGIYRVDLLSDFFGLFPHNSWSAFQSDFKRKSDFFLQPARPKVFTLTATRDDCAESLLELAKALSVTEPASTSARSLRGSRDQLTECIERLRKDFASYFVRNAMCAKGNLFAKKWNGTQHVLSCVCLSASNPCTASKRGIAALGYASERAVSEMSRSNQLRYLAYQAPAKFMYASSINVDVFASNKCNGFSFTVDASFSNQTIFALTEHFWLVEVLRGKSTARNITEIVIVDCAAICETRRLSFVERKSLVDATFTTDVLNAFTNATSLALRFRKQRWRTLPRGVESAASALRKITSAATTDVESTAQSYDGILVYENRRDLLFKVKPVQTVDLWCDSRGVLFTQNRVTIGKCSKAMTTRIRSRSIATTDGDENASKAIIAEFAVTLSLLSFRSQQPRASTIRDRVGACSAKKLVSLKFIKPRCDRVTANTYLEFTEIVKAALVEEVIKKFANSV